MSPGGRTRQRSPTAMQYTASSGELVYSGLSARPPAYGTVQGIALQARKANKALYVFSVDSDGGKVAHVNFVPPSMKEKVDARKWAQAVTDIIGGKVRPISDHCNLPFMPFIGRW